MIKAFFKYKERQRLQKSYEKYSVSEPFKIAGYSFRLFQDVATMPNIRKIAYLDALRDYQNGVESHDLHRFSELIIKEINNNQLATVGYLANVLRNYTSLAYNDDLLLNLANSVILLNDEDPVSPSGKTNQIKLDLCKKEPEIRNFFFLIALKSVNAYKDLSTLAEVEDYLKQPMTRQIKSVWKSEIL